jgi:V/A-type H+-transporting ATPase subunit G/H
MGENGDTEGPPEGAQKTTRHRSRTHVPEHEIAEIRDISFPVAMRGYEREAVDSYVSRVNRLLAELQITAAPESAIRNALDEVADETRGILERAHEAAEGITRRSRSQADDRLQRAEEEAEEVRTSADTYARETREAAEERLRTLDTDSDRIWKEREALIADLRERAHQLEQAAAAAEERYPERPNLRAPKSDVPAKPLVEDPLLEDDETTRDLFAEG